MRTLREMDEVQLTQYFSMLGEAVENIMPGGPSAQGRALFCLVVFDDPGLAQYVSNCSRETRIQAIREIADRMEQREVLERRNADGNA